jgi:hypothetical protein
LVKKFLGAVLALAFAAGSARAAAITWTGGAAGDWNVAGNWTPASVPGAFDDISVPSGTVVAYSTGPALGVASLTLGAAGVTPPAILQISTGLAMTGAMLLTDGAALQVSTGASVSASDITLLAGTSVAFTADPAASAPAPFLRLYASGTLSLASGSTITVRGRGYAAAAGAAPGAGPGGGGAGSAGNGGGGGGHAGPGGNGGGAVNGGAAFDALFPADAGGGGGGSPSAGGAAGGGALYIAASTAVLDGLISADGDDAPSVGFQGGGGGAGGAVIVDVGLLRGAGTVTAQGGSGGTAATFGGGGGGGGRVWIREQTFTALGSTLTVRSGGGTFGAGGTFGGSGQAGTQFLEPQHWTGGGANALASNAGNWSGGAVPLGGARLVFGASATLKSCTWDLSVIPSSVTILPQFSTAVVLASSMVVPGSFDMAGGTMTAAAGLALRVDGALSQTGGRLNLSVSTITVGAAGGSVAVLFFDAAAKNFVVGGAVPATATVSGALTVVLNAGVNALAQLKLATGTMTMNGDGPFVGSGGVSASTGQWIVAGGALAQTWTQPNGNFGSLRASNFSGGGLTFSTAAGPITLTGGLTVDSAAVLHAVGTALNVGGNWSVFGTALTSQSTVTFAGASGSTLAVVAGASFDNLVVAGPALTVNFSTTVTVASTMTVAAGTLNLAGSTVSVRGNWTETGGLVIGGVSRTAFDGAGPQAVATMPGNAFGAFISSSAGGVTLASAFTSKGAFEWHRGPLNFAGRSVTIGGDMPIKGGVLLTFAGSTVTFNGVSTQTINFTTLDSVVVDNPNPVVMANDSTYGNFTINPGRFFNAGIHTLTIIGDRWNTAGAAYASVSQQHSVTWNPPSSITIGAGSVVNAKLALGINKTAILLGGLFVDGAGNSFDPKQGSTVVNAPGGSTITFRGSSDLSPSSGPNWFYAGDVANSWMVFQGTGGSRGAFISSNTFGSIQVALSTNTSIFQPPDLNLLGSLIISTGIVRPIGSKTIALRGDLLQSGGVIDFNTASTGTIRFIGASSQTLSLLPGTTLWNLVADGIGTVIAASGVRCVGDFTVNSGTFQAGAFNHFFLSAFLVAPSGTFDGQGSTATFNGALIGHFSQSVSFFGSGAFHGLSVAASSVTFQASTTIDVLTDPVAGSTIAVAAGATLRVGDFRMGSSTGTPQRLASTIPGVPWFLQVLSASSVTMTAVSDSNAGGGLLVNADDGRSVDLGGNTNWNFKPRLLVLLPGETFTPGVAPGKTGVPSVSTAGVAITVTVRAVSSRFDQVTRATETVTLATDDPGTVAPAPLALVLGTTSFTLIPRGAEPSPRTTNVTATANFGTGASALAVVPNALARLQVILPGESPLPGSPTGKTGGASARVKGIPFAATVRAVDNFWNVISTITDTVAPSISAASATLPAPLALAAGQATFAGVVVYATGSFTLAATDLTQPGVASGTSAVFGVSPPSLTAPTLGGFVPNGARVATLGGAVSGFATDGSAVERVLVDLRDIDAGLHFDWNAQSFSSVGPFFATATLASPLTQGTTWFRPAADAAFTDGHRVRLTMQANNPTGLMAQATSTFTFDRAMLSFGAKDGQGSAAILPVIAAGCEELVSTVTLTVGAAGIAPGGAVAVRAPEGWTLPLGTTSAYPPPLGYWNAASASLAASLGSTTAVVSPAASGPVPLGPGWLLLGVATNSARSYLPGETIVLTYRSRPPFGLAGRGPQAFALMTRGDASGVLLPVSTAPVVSLGAGNTSYLTFVDPSPLSLAPLTASATMQVLVVDLCGNPKPGVSSGTVSLSLSVLSGGGAVPDATAQFFNAAGGPIASIGLSTGLAAAASPSFAVRTSTDAPAELIMRANATFSGVGFAPIAVEASRSVRLRAALPVFTSVSVDTGAPSPGTTSALLSAADPAGSAAQIRFTFAEPELAWTAEVSSDAVSFSSPAFSAAGFGDANHPIVLGWDGLDRTRTPPAYPAAGRFKVRLRAGGGAALDSSLEIVVPPTAGFAGRLGARGAGALVRASGPGAGDGWAVASSTGYFELRGLRPGQAYALSAATSAVVLGRGITLSTSIAAGAAASPLSDLGTLALPATAYLRVALLAPAPSPREVLGAFVARLPDGTAAFSGTLRFSSGSATSDDGGTLFGRSASTWSVSAAAPGLYDVDIAIPDLGLSTRAAGVSVPAGGGADLAVSLAKKTNVFGWVILPSTVAFGTFVTVQATLAGRTDPGAYGGFYLSSAPSVSGPSSGAYALYGLDPGTWTVLARAPGFTASSTTVLAAGTADVAGVNLTPGLGARITGSLSVPGDTRQATQCFPAPGGAPAPCPAGSYEVEVEALGVGRLDREAARVRLGAHVSFSSSAFVLSGLDAGTYAVRASLPGFGLVPPQGATVTVAAGGTAAVSFSLVKLDARLRLDIAVPPLPGGACRSTTSYRSLGLMLEPDGAAPLVFGDGTAMAPFITSARAQVSTVTGAFMLLNCSSVTVFTPALPPGGVRATALFSGNGGLARARATLADGATAALVLDVSGSTFAVTGAVSYAGVVGFSTRTAGGQPFTVAVSSIAGILNAAPPVSFCLLGSGSPTTLSALRAELLPYDPAYPPLRRAPAVAAGACAAPAASTAPYASAAFLATVNPDGTFVFAGVSPGLYLLRVPGELDEDASDGPEASEAGTLVVVGTAPVSASLRLSRGRRVSGRVAAPSGLANGRTLRVTLSGQDGAPVRSADVSCGADGVSYTLDGVPDGRYRLDAADLGRPVIWTAAPVEVVVAGADLDGRDTALVGAATIRARLSLARPLPDGTIEHVLVSAENSFLLPRGFAARATAVPYAAGGSVAARAAADGSVVDADGRVVIEGLLPGTYDVEFTGPADAAPGAVAFAPARVSGVALAAGQAADLGVVPLFAGAAVTGFVGDAATGLPVAGAVVSARPSLRSGAADDGASATADAAGRYVLRGLSPSTRWYDLTASGPAHAAARVSSLDVSSGAAKDFALAGAPATMIGRIVSSDGSPLVSALGGAAVEAPGAALFLQRAGVLPADDPLADLALRTDPDGRFSIPSLATASYRLTVAASGQAGLTRSAVVAGTLTDLGTLTLGGGGSISGSLRLPDGSPVPDDELSAVAAVTPDLSEFIYGSVTRDAAARAAVAYKIGGLRPGRTYRVLALTPDAGATAPPEASAVVLTSTAEARVQNLVVRPPAPSVSARARRAGTRVTVDFQFSRPLRARSASDDDASLVVTTAAAAGVLSGWRMSSDRRHVDVDYDAGVGESSFTLRASAPTSALDYDAADPAAPRELVASATAAFFTGEASALSASVANAVGATLASEGDAGRVVLPRGAFAVDASSAVTVTLRRAAVASGVSAASLSPALRSAAAALPATLPAQSDFYEIVLPAGVPSTLARPAQLTVVYSSAAADPSALNLYWFNPGSGQYVLQPDALGSAPVRDAQARSITFNVGHFSTFVLLDSAAGAIGGSAHGGDLEAYNFPNPFDLQIKSVTTIHGAGAQTVRGTMVRVGVPPNLTGPGKLRVFDVTGRVIRTIDMGLLAGGQSYYQGWDGRNDDGRDVASGLYVGQVEIGSKRKSFKMAVIK